MLYIPEPYRHLYYNISPFTNSFVLNAVIKNYAQNKNLQIDGDVSFINKFRPKYLCGTPMRDIRYYLNKRKRKCKK